MVIWKMAIDFTKEFLNLATQSSKELAGECTTNTVTTIDHDLHWAS